MFPVPLRRVLSSMDCKETDWLLGHGLIVGLIWLLQSLGCGGQATAPSGKDAASQPMDLGARLADGNSIPFHDAPLGNEVISPALPDSPPAEDTAIGPDFSSQADRPSPGDTPSLVDGPFIAIPSPDAPPSLLLDSAFDMDVMDRPSENNDTPIGLDAFLAVDSVPPVDSIPPEDSVPHMDSAIGVDAAGACIAESDVKFCVRTGRSCGSVVANDNCGQIRTVDCGQCASGQYCDSTNQCACASESIATFCAYRNKACGTFTGTDNCGYSRIANCGTCGAGQQCNLQNQCEKDCDASDCRTICASSSECRDAGYCADAFCAEKKQLGATCSDDDMCASSHCVDRVCCNVASCTASDVCSAASCVTGTCTNVNKAACALAACELVAASCPVVDSDGDGFSDAWETNGYVDVNCNGIEDEGDVALPGANPAVPDIYVLYDWMELQGSGAACATDATCAVDEKCTAGQCTGHTHDPEALAPGALDLVSAQFTARGFNLHIIRGHARPHSHISSFRTPTANCEGANVTPGTLGAYAVNFYDVKNAAPYPFDPAYRRIYHYALFAHDSGCDSDEHCQSCTISSVGFMDVLGQTGQAEISGNDFVVSLGTNVQETLCASDRKFFLGGTFMHELGHNLGLRHGGGVDPEPCNNDADCAAYGPDHTGETCHVWQEIGDCVHVAECGPGQRCDQNKCRSFGCVHTCATANDCTSLGSQHAGESCESGVCVGNFAEDLPGFKPNYLSVMNYRYQFVGIYTAAVAGGACLDGGRRLDYAVQILPTGGNTPFMLDETQLNEPAGLGSGNSDYFTFMNGHCNSRRSPSNGAVDWDGDGVADNPAATADLNPNEDPTRNCGDVTNEILLGHADWGWALARSRFTYRFQCSLHMTDGHGNSAGTAIRRNAYREQTIAEAKQHGSLLHDRAVNVSLRPGYHHNWKAASSWSEVPVVVYGDADLDVEAIDPASIRLGRALAESISLSDVNGDGFADLVATFVVSKTGLRPNSRGSMFVARMESSQLLFGNDQVVLLPAENQP